MIFIVLIGYALIVFLDIIPTYKDGTRKEFWVSTGILSVSFVLFILLSFEVQIPSPADPLEQLITTIFGL